VFVENSVAAADSRLAVAKRIESEADARCPIEEARLVAVAVRAVGAAGDFAVVRIANARHERALLTGDVTRDIDLRRLCGVVM